MTDIRKKIFEKFNGIIKNKRISMQIEKGIYDYTIKHVSHKHLNPNEYWNNKLFKKIYMNKCISLYTNLDSESYVSNEELLRKIKKKEIDAYNLANMSYQELFPDNWEDILKKKSAEDEFLYTMKGETITNQYTCGRCKKNECSQYQIQIRSADEPMTTFVTCLSCGHKWKF